MRRGYSLVVVMMTLGLMTVSIFSLWAFLNSAVAATRDSIDQRRTFYVCDGMTRMVGLLIGDYASTTSAPSRSDAYAFITAPSRGGANLVNVAPNGYVVSDLHIDELALVGDNVRVPNGPYEGLLGREVAMRFSLTARRNDGEVACKIDKTLALSQIGMFSFGLFGAFDNELTLIQDAAELRVGGRVHSNADICIGATVGGLIWIDTLTAVGQVRAPLTQLCAFSIGGLGSGPARISYQGANPVGAMPPVGADFHDIDNTTDATSATWAADSQATWNGRVKDSAHAVGKLVLPVSKWVQSVTYAEGTDGALQHGELRPLVDPPFAAESSGDKQNKLAYQADLRIIDGVWYLRDPINPTNWPGKPIWSDHAGNANDVVDAAFNARDAAVRTIKVGQADIGGGARRYSYYEYNAVAGGIDDGGTRGVVSYGSVVFDPVAGFWVPGLASEPNAATNGPTGFGGRFCTDRNACKHDTMSIAPAVSADELVFATDHRYFDPMQRRFLRIINFDVAALQNALAAAAPELGGYFDAGRPFNGIVWISSLFPTAWSNVHSDRAMPGPGRIDANMDVDGTPYALCSNSVAKLSASVGATPCTDAKYQAVGAPFLNAVRIINAAQVNRSVPGYAPPVPLGGLPHGLTIASNLPMIVLGDVNVSSTPADTPTQAGLDEAAAVPWVPMMVAGDIITLQSRSWSDRYFQSEERLQDVDATGFGPVAAPTEYHMAIIAGMQDSTAKNNAYMRGVLRTNEDWNVPLVIRGSVVIAHEPVYALAANKCAYGNGMAGLAQPQLLDIRYDHRMGRIDRQPPGALLFSIEAVRNWQRR